jgi:hypothetical protein
MPLSLALMLVEPVASVVAKPELSIVATAVSLDVQVNVPKTAAVPSVKVPLAANCCVFHTVMLADVGVMESVTSSGAVTVNVVLLEVMPFAEAVMVVVPCVREEAMPLAFSVATVVSLDVQLAEPEMLPDVPSEYVPVAVKVTGIPFGVEGAVGLMLMPVTVAAVTVSGAAGEIMPLNEAITVVMPTATPVATPVELLILATAVSVACQITLLVMSAVVLSV